MFFVNISPGKDVGFCNNTAFVCQVRPTVCRAAWARNVLSPQPGKATQWSRQHGVTFFTGKFQVGRGEGVTRNCKIVNAFFLVNDFQFL